MEKLLFCVSFLFFYYLLTKYKFYLPHQLFEEEKVVVLRVKAGSHSSQVFRGDCNSLKVLCKVSFGIHLDGNLSREEGFKMKQCNI